MCRNFERYFKKEGKQILPLKIQRALSNFLRAVRKYLRKSTDPRDLEAEINGYPEIYFKSWLLRKVRGRGD